jgi:hypothetical protein
MRGWAAVMSLVRRLNDRLKLADTFLQRGTPLHIV